MTGKYKPLGEVYLDKSFGKKLPPLPRQILEKATILIQRDPPHGNIETHDISDEKLQKISRIIGRSEELEKSLKEYIIKTINLPEDAANLIIEKISELEEAEKRAVVEYIYPPANRSITIEDLDGKNVFDVYATMGIPKGFTQFLYRMEIKPDSGPAVGKGEAFFSLMIKGARKASGIKKDEDTGDVRVEGREVEIKGQDARLKGQRGFGAGESVPIYWSESLQELSKNYPEINSIIPPPNDYRWNLKSGGYALEQIGQLFIQASQNKFTIENLKNLWKEGFRKLYINATLNDFNFIDEAYKTGKLNNSILEKELKRFAALYYFNTQNIESIILSKFALRQDDFSKKDKNKIKPSAARSYGRLVILTKQDIESGEAFKKVKFKLPQLAGRAGAQGSSLGVNIIGSEPDIE